MKNQQSSAQSFFLNLGVVVTLYAVIISFLTLVFSIINRVFPDTLSMYYGDTYSTGVRFALASLIIIFPLFLWLSKIVTKAIMKDEAWKNSSIRRWMVYITLFLSSVTLVVDLVTLLNSFLSGNLTMRFVLKVVAVLVVAGIVFWHYLGEIRDTNTYKKYIITVSIASVLVLAGIVTTFAVFGSPSSVRQARFDNQRVNDLQSIQWRLTDYYQNKGALPTKLEDLNDSLYGYTNPLDPETGNMYEYQKASLLSFKICADFATGSDTGKGDQVINRGYGYSDMLGPNSTVWAHDAGKTCFDRTIDSDFYPVRK